MPALTEQHFLDLFDRLLSPDYLAPMKANAGPGYEALRAFAPQSARVSQAVANSEEFAFIITSLGGVRATGTVFFSRPDGPTPEFVLAAGTRVTTSKGHRTFVTTEDVLFTASDLGPHEVAIQAIAPGWEWNVPGEATTAAGVVLPGEIDTILFLNEDPVLADITLTVRQVDATVDGRASVLDQLGADRGLPRNPGEADPQYRLRIRALPDTVTPAAIRRAIAGFFSLYDLSGAFIETFDPTFQTCWDCPAGYEGIDPDLFCYDDPRPNPPFRNRWMDEIEMAGAFIVVVPNLGTIADAGMAYDDPALDLAGLTCPETQGFRGTPAYDVPADLGFGLLQGGYDGEDAPKAAVYKGLFDLLQKVKAGGVAATVELEGN